MQLLSVSPISLSIAYTLTHFYGLLCIYSIQESLARIIIELSGFIHQSYFCYIHPLSNQGQCFCPLWPNTSKLKYEQAVVPITTESLCPLLYPLATNAKLTLIGKFSNRPSVAAATTRMLLNLRSISPREPPGSYIILALCSYSYFSNIFSRINHSWQ